MRSEEEIKEKKFNEFAVEVKFDKPPTNIVLSMDIEKLKEWVLGGELRFSVAELEKIEKAWDGYDSDNFVEFLKDKRKLGGL